MSSRRNAAACLESGTLPGRFLSRRTWPGNLQLRQRVEHQLLVEPAQRTRGFLHETPEPVTDAACGRHAGQPTEAADHGIAGEVAQVLQAARAGVQQGEGEQPEVSAGVIAAQGRARGAQPPRQRAPARIAPDQLQAPVRRELLRDELGGEISLTTCRKLPALKRIRGASGNRRGTWGRPLS